MCRVPSLVLLSCWRTWRTSVITCLGGSRKYKQRYACSSNLVGVVVLPWAFVSPCLPSWILPRSSRKAPDYVVHGYRALRHALHMHGAVAATIHCRTWERLNPCCAYGSKAPTPLVIKAHTGGKVLHQHPAAPLTRHTLAIRPLCIHPNNDLFISMCTQPLHRVRVPKILVNEQDFRGKEPTSRAKQSSISPAKLPPLERGTWKSVPQFGPPPPSFYALLSLFCARLHCV